MTKPKDDGWLDEILTKLEKVDVKRDMLETLESIKPNETRVSTASFYEKRLFILSKQFIAESVELMGYCEPKEIDDRLEKISEKRGISQLLTSLFWVSVRQRLGSAAHNKGVELREDWAICTFEVDQPDCDLECLSFISRSSSSIRRCKAHNKSYN